MLSSKEFTLSYNGGYKARYQIRAKTLSLYKLDGKEGNDVNKLSKQCFVMIMISGLSMTVLSGCDDLAASALSNVSVTVTSQDSSYELKFPQSADQPAADTDNNRDDDKKEAGGFDEIENLSEEELNVLLNRSDLEGLGEIDGTIYITGHKSPDSDTVCGSIACAELLKQLGYDAQAVIIGDINKESAYILKEAGVDAPEQLRDESGKNMIIVDHSEYSHDLESLKDANVLGIIDHHGIGSLTTGNQVIYDARPLGSTNTVIWIRYRNYGVEPDRKMATLMLGGILSDTNNLKTNVTFADRAAVSILSKTAGIDDVEAFYDGMHKEFLSHEGMTDEEIFFSDYKEYEAGNTKYCIACVNCYDEDEVRELAERMSKIMPATLKETGMDMAFTQVSVVNDKLNVCYLVYAGDGAKETVAEALADRHPEEKGNVYVLRPGISRKTVLVPALTEVLNAYPKE